MNKPDKTASERARRFKETARSLDCDESGEAFERAFGKIVPPKTPADSKSVKKEKTGKQGVSNSRAK